MKWWRGSTASGSSGSPLIDMDTQQVVGVLTGGYASCAAPDEPDYYGRLSAVRCPSIPSTPLCLSALHPKGLVAPVVQCHCGSCPPGAAEAASGMHHNDATGKARSMLQRAGLGLLLDRHGPLNCMPGNASESHT